MFKVAGISQVETSVKKVNNIASSDNTGLSRSDKLNSLSLLLGNK